MALTNPTVIANEAQAIGGPGKGNADRFKPEIRDKILMYGPNISPLTLISSKSKSRSVSNPKYQIMHDKQLPRFDRVNNGGGYNTTDVTIAVDTGELFRPYDMVRVTRTAENFLVTAVSSDNLTVERAYDTTGNGTGVAMLDNDELMIIGNAMSEKQASPQSLVPDPTTITNFIQRFSRVTNVTEQRIHTDEFGEPELERIKKHATVELKKDLEYAFMFGKPLQDIEAASPLDGALQQTRHLTGGLQHWIDSAASANAHDAGGTITQTQLWDWVQPLFENMPEDTTNQDMELMALCSAKAFRVFHTWGIPAVEISEKSKSYGLQLRTYLTPVGKLTLVQDYILRGDEYDNWMFIVNPGDVEYVYQQGMDVQLKSDIQANDVLEQKDELYGFVGFGLNRPELHAYIKNMDLAA